MSQITLAYKMVPRNFTRCPEETPFSGIDQRLVDAQGTLLDLRDGPMG